MMIKYNIRRHGEGSLVNKMYCPWCGETRGVWERWNEFKEDPSIPIRGISDVITKQRNLLVRSFMPEKSIVKSCICYTCEAEWKWYPLSTDNKIYITKKGIVPVNPLAACPWCGETRTIWDYLKDDTGEIKGISGGLIGVRHEGFFIPKSIQVIYYDCRTCGAEWSYE